MNISIKSRLAPTPSGYLHFGNGLSFLLTWAKTREQGGQLLLRIDDMDKERCRKEYIQDIFETIDWLGIDYDEGPQSVDDFEKKWSQFHRLDMYHSALIELKEKGQLFACSCSRKTLSENQLPNGHYPGICLNADLPFGAENTAWRLCLPIKDKSLKMQDDENQNPELRTSKLDHFIVRQKNQRPAYQLSSLIDDTHYGINFIVRGGDLLPSSWNQLYLAELLDIASFPETNFWHHPLILNDKGEKLSKSKGAGSLKAMREQGLTPQKLYRVAANHLGIKEKVENPSELLSFLNCN